VLAGAHQMLEITKNVQPFQVSGSVLMRS
jgi:hypothetical protein